MLFCRDVTFLHALLKDWVHETTMSGAPKIIGSFLARFLNAATGEFGHQVYYCAVAPDESSVEIREPEEGLEFFLLGRNGPVNDTSDLDLIHAYGSFAYYYPKVFCFQDLELTLLGL